MATSPFPMTDEQEQPKPAARQFTDLTDDEVLDYLKDKLRAIITQEIDMDSDPERLLQIAAALKSSLYWQGKQYLRLGARPDDSLAYMPLEMAAGDDTFNSMAAFRYVFNIIRADGMKFTAVLGQRAPHVAAVADDTEDETSVQKASDANAVIRYFHDKWKADHLQKDVARHIYRTGPCFAYTFYNADGSKYGYTEVPDVTTKDQQIGQSGYKCPNCQTMNELPQCANCKQELPPDTFEEAPTVQVPKVNGTKKVPKGGVELQLLTVFEADWPSHAKSIEECDRFCYETTLHKTKLLAIYANQNIDRKADPVGYQRQEKIRGLINSEAETDMTGGKQAAADAREILQSQTVNRTFRKNMARFSQYWLRPQWFEMFTTTGIPREVVDQMYDRWPHGIRVTMIRGTPVRIEGRLLDRDIAVFKTGTDEKILADPVCMDNLPIQDNTNHFGNLATETILRGIPKTIVDAALIDRRALEENEPLPGEAIFTRGNNVGNLSNMIAKMPTAEFSQQMMPFGNYLREMSREMNGVTEAIFGGGEPGNTFRGDLLRKNQALMQLGVHFDEMQAGWEGAYYNAICQLAEYGSDSIQIPSQELENGADIVNLQSLADGIGWHTEANEDIPLTDAEETEQVMDLVTQNPLVAQRLDLMGDQNIERLSQMLRIRNFKSRRLVEQQKFQQILRQLLLEGPIQPPPPPPPMPGQLPLPPQPPQPSVPIDMFQDDHAFMAQAARDYLNSRAGLKLQKTNPPAFQNVLAWGQAHQAAAAPPPMAPPPGPPPKVPGPPKPGGPPKGGINSLTAGSVKPPQNTVAPPGPQQTTAPQQ